MRANQLHLSLNAGAKGPLFLQVAAAVLEAIQDQRILPGVALPGVRDLAERLGVTVNTILAALRELQAQGWIESRERSGFFIADPLPATLRSKPGSGTGSGGLGFELPSHLSPMSSTANVVMDLTEGTADPRLAPAQALGRAYQRALKLKGPELLGTSDLKGHRRLREALCAHLQVQRAMAVAPEQMLILSSAVMAVNVVAQAFLGAEGGVVLVENPGNPAVWETLRQSAQAELRPLSVDQQGARPEALLECLQSGRPPLKLLVLTPQCHYPTGASLSEERRAQFLELSRQHRFPILELDSEYDYLPVGRPSRPLAVDAPGQVIYVGNLSRIMAPGVRASYLVAPEALSNLLARARRHLDWQGDPIQEWALSELLLDGEIERQLHRVRKAVSERREALEDALQHAFAGRISFEPGAMAMWLRGIGPLADPGAFSVWVKGCQSRGLKLRTGRHYDLLAQERAATRFGYTAFTPEELQRAVASMV